MLMAQQSYHVVRIVCMSRNEYEARVDTNLENMSRVVD